VVADRDALKAYVQEYLAADRSAGAGVGGAAEDRVDQLLQMVWDGKYQEAYRELHSDKSMVRATKLELMRAVNSSYLLERELEWTNHGILRSFRFWSLEEKQEYLAATCDMMGVLKKVSPHVSLGFGSVLAIVRDADFIPHDDDMDILIAFDVEHVTKFSDALALVERTLASDGYAVHGKLPSHRNAKLKGGKPIDVFAGFIEEGMVSWFPSARKNLRVDQVFPTKVAQLFGIECEIPGKPEEYLTATYGADWRNPIPNWNHPWNRAEYSEFL
jgi:hypothetical protein